MTWHAYPNDPNVQLFLVITTLGMLGASMLGSATNADMQFETILNSIRGLLDL